MRHLLHVAPRGPAPPTTHRALLLSTVLTTVLVLGAIAAVPSVIVALVDGAPLIALVGIVGVGSMAALRFLPSISHRVRTLCFLGLIYAMGVWFLFQVGWVSHVYLIAVPVMAAVLLGLRPAIVALAINAATLLVAGLAFGVGPYLAVGGRQISPGTDAPTTNWFVFTINFLFVDAALAISCAVLFTWFERSYLDEQRVSDSLVAQRLNLHRTNDTLVHEIAERKRIEADLSRVATAVDQAREVILIASPSGRIVYRNAAAQELGRRMGGAQHLQRLDDLHPAGATDASGNDDWVGSFVVPAGIGTGFHYELTVATVRDGSGRIQNSIAVLRDVTAERQLEERAQRAERLEALGTLASGVAHDFNNIIASVLGTTEWMRDHLDDPTELEASCAIIVAAAERATGIVREMMALGRRSQPARHALSLRTAVRSSLPLLRSLVPAGIELRSTVHTEAIVLATLTEIDRVLTNLVVNARDSITGSTGVISIVLDVLEAGIDHSSDPSGRDTPALGLRPGRAYARISISDTGHGIDPADVNRIFDPFFTTRHGEGGTGLGLAGVSAIINGLGGDIDVFSEVGFGSTFVVHLPIAEADAGPGAGPGAGAGAEHPTATADSASPVTDGSTAGADGGSAVRVATVLLVEDDAALLTVFARSLTRDGYRVLPTASAVEALDAFERHSGAIDLVLTDMTMPQMTGTELLAELHARRPDLPAILMSGLGEGEFRSGPLDAESTTFLQKPFSTAELTAAVRVALHVHATDV